MADIIATRAGAGVGSVLRPTVYVTVALLSLLLIIPIAAGDGFLFHVFITICVYGALATAWNIVGGFGGQLSLGHTIFYGIGAYVGVFLVMAGITPWLGMIAGALVSAAVAAAIAYPCFRLRGPFFVLATIAFLEVIRLLALNQQSWTGGAVGLMVPLQIGWEWMIFRESTPQLIIAFGPLVLTIGVSAAIRQSRFGYYLIATREREDAAMAAGINTVGVKLYAVMVSAGLTSMVGTFHGMYITFIEPESVFSLAFAIQIAMFALIGGIGTVLGPLFGTLLVVPLTELARGWLGAQANGLHGFVYGTALLLIVLFMRDGLVGQFRGVTGRLLARLPGAERDTGDAEASASQPASVAPATVERPPIGEPILVADRLAKSFGGLVVTDQVSFSLREGEVLGIIGPNGAGKTTLFNQLSGFLRPDEGTVSVRAPSGQMATPTSPHAFARLGVGRTFQIVQPFAAMTVLENIMIGAFHHHGSIGVARDRALAVCDRMGLWRFRDTEARNLTVGGLKRLEVARVMALEPRILLLDEVMAGLNQTDVRQAVELVKSIRDTGVSIIAIEHVMQAIMSLSDRVIVINSGRMIAEGKPEEVVRNPTVVEAYLGGEYVHAQAS